MQPNPNIQSDIVLFSSAFSDVEAKAILSGFGETKEMSGASDYYSESTDRPMYSHALTCKTIDSLLHTKITALLDKFCEIFTGLDVKGGTPFRLNEYQKGHGYKLHTDRSHRSSTTAQRELSVVIGLNSDYEGGLLNFPRQNYSIKLSAGDVIFFPSCFTHPHEVQPVTSGIRKTVVTWLS